MEREAFYRTMIEFVNGLTDESGGEKVAPDDNLFDNGYLSSLSVVQVMTFLEELSGGILDPALYDLESFSTLERLYGVLEDLRTPAEAVA
ncbi:hypothetical protein ACFQ07_28465 [Actinomadura adrarensis]|uniref:Carrier domain-containing protein n=1 Tax=Actinomadura adrarensis TaxID=1819600 RepID=A0ABW3CNV8_9ACTN